MTLLLIHAAQVAGEKAFGRRERNGRSYIVCVVKGYGIRFSRVVFIVGNADVSFPGIYFADLSYKIERMTVSKDKGFLEKGKDKRSGYRGVNDTTNTEVFLCELAQI